MGKKLLDKEHSEELKDMVNNRKKGQPVEQVLTIFCERHGLAMADCRKHYDELVKKGQIKEK